MSYNDRNNGVYDPESYTKGIGRNFKASVIFVAVLLAISLIVEGVNYLLGNAPIFLN
ncbi:hypothetical protein [Draconibacterium halophilum]|uniref:Uncharacterized protein n=1 Tax=Draconibacterium halophilum TaxID=2706887 RepID=A0A6C0RDX5_9BACT|nr:hypothetical protein [Draconibacterium halophilum]QIA08257.1 hypothetical protein G0Q07_11265 [Draconibacterium halophilum]